MRRPAVIAVPRLFPPAVTTGALFLSCIDELQVWTHVEPRCNSDVVKELYALLVIEAGAFNQQRWKGIAH
jgi:hypothetical protein